MPQEVKGWVPKKDGKVDTATRSGRLWTSLRRSSVGAAVEEVLVVPAGRVLGLRLYADRNDVWVGYYRGDSHHYVCPLPTLVIRWPRKEEV